MVKVKKFLNWIFSTKISIIFVACGIALGLAMSMISEKFFGFSPCKLCMAQRISFAGGLTILTLAALFHNPKIWKPFLFLGVACLMSALLFSGYQLLVQFELLPEPEFCSVNTSLASKSVEEIEKILQESSYAASCKSLGPTFLGMPISFFGCLGSFGGIAYLLISYMLNGKK